MRVSRGFAFIDLSGFTSFTDAHGDEEAGAVLADFRTAVRDASSRRGVRVAKWQGDGAMIVGVEVRPLVEAVLEIEQRIDSGPSPLRLRAGITAGRVIIFEGDDYIGSAVNLAARLCDIAAPYEILAGCEVTDFVPPWASTEPVPPVEIRGFAHPVPVLRLRHRGKDAADRVEDPICRMALPADGVVARRGEASFCSESCADAWDELHRVAVG